MTKEEEEERDRPSHPPGATMTTMTEQDARLHENAILSALVRLGYYPGAPFELQGGDLHVHPHPELPTHWTVTWQPRDAALQPVDLGEFPVKTAAHQVGRYKLTSYATVLRRFEGMLAALKAADVTPLFRQRSTPDSFFAGGLTLSIQDRTDGAHQPKYIIELADDMPVEVGDNARAPAPHYTDVTLYEPRAVVELVKNARR
jgi:hypothetical protein